MSSNATQTPHDPYAERLFKARVIIISGGIDQELAERVTAQLLAMSAESKDPITVYLNSQGGHVEAGDTIHDMIKFVDAPVRIVFRPLMEAFYQVPKSALIPVTSLWLGLGDASKVTLIALGCVLPVAIGAYNGARGGERVLIWSGRSLGAGKLRTLVDVVVPSALPALLNGIRTALALSLVLLVSSELIVAKNGLGYLIGFLGGGGI